MVNVRRSDGRRLSAPLSAFCEKDREYIRTWARDESFRSQMDFRIEVEKKETGKQTGKEEGLIIEAEEYRYEVLLENRSGHDFRNLRVDYMLFYKQEEAASHADAKMLDVSGSIEVPVLEAGGEKTVTTGPVVLKSLELMPGYVWENNAPASSTGKLKGYWVRVYRKSADGDEIFREVCNPSAIAERNTFRVDRETAK
ncbi:hypothetical protein [Kiritimatiella glycovorans]|nr:hypothetical protein [Kiritimatiella glycovorans]